MPVFYVRGVIEVPFECEITASDELKAATYVEMRFASDVFNEYVGSFDCAEVVVGTIKEKDK